MAGDLRSSPLFPHRLSERPRDPVTIGTLALTAIGAEAVAGTVIIGSLTVAGLTGTVITAAALVGLNYALAKTAPDSAGNDFGSVAGINTPESRGSIRQAAAPQRRVYGRILVGGVWYFYDDHTPPYQYISMAIARGRISAIRSLRINKMDIRFSGGAAFDSILDPIAVDGQDFAGHLKMCFRQGLDAQIKDPLLEAYFPASGSEIIFDSTGLNVTNLPATFRQRGIATATFRADFGTTEAIYESRWGRVPFIDPLIEVDGHPVFDPRDATQDIDDESTYKFTYDGHDNGRNPSLIQANWLTQDFGGRLRTDQIRLDELADAADYDDEIVHDRDGNPRVRHQADGVVLLNDNPRQVTEALLTANAAWIVNSRGRCGWVPARPLDPIVTITERDLRGGFTFQDSSPKRDQFNHLRSRFTPPEKDYSEDDGPPVDRPDLLAIDGELLDTTVRMPFTTDQRAVQWLSQQFLELSREGKGLELPALVASPRLLKCKIGDVIRVHFRRRYTEVNGIYQLRKDGYSPDFSALSWSLRAYDKTIFSRDRASDQADFQVATAA